jgi:hypothetical protein
MYFNFINHEYMQMGMKPMIQGDVNKNLFLVEKGLQGVPNPKNL